jgi:hypothetical protein
MIAVVALATCASVPAGSAGRQRSVLPPPRPAELPGSLRPSGSSPSQTPTPAASEDKAEAPADQPAATDSACLTAFRARYGGTVRAVALPVGEVACAVTEPVELGTVSIRSGTKGEQRSVALQPPVTLACAMAAAVAEWLETSVQPLSRGYYGQDVTSVTVGGGHECRRRNRQSLGPLSEHATGRALDIFAIGLGTDPARTDIVVARPAGHDAFLKALRHSACGAFMTALGPGSDAAHADHLHLDIQPRRASSRFCQ